MTVYAYNKFFKTELEVIGSYGAGGQKLVYADAMTPFVKMLKHRLKNHYQNIIVITGPTGSGKSSLAIQLCKALDKNWSLRDNYIYGVDDLAEKLDAPNPSPISLFDEGSVSLCAGNSQRKEDRQMIVLFETMRSLGWTTVICIPKLARLNKQIRENYANFVLMCPSKSPMKGYSPRGFYEIHELYTRDWGNPYYPLRATSVFKPLKPSINKEYQIIKKDHQMKLMRQFIKDQTEDDRDD